MRAGPILICCVVAGRLAAASPATIVATRADVYRAPSDNASVVSEIGRGATVCTADATGEPGAAPVGAGWLAIRLPDHHGIGYVRRESIDLAALAPDAWELCGEPPPAIDMSSPPPLPPPPPPTIRFLRPVARPTSFAPRPAPAPVEPWTPAGQFMPLHPARLALGFDLGAAWLQDVSAAQNHIGDSGALLNFRAGVAIYDMVSISGSVGVVFPGDNASFTQQVVPQSGGGDPMSATSQVSVVTSSIAIGLRTPFLALGARGFSAAAFADYGWSAFHAERSISDCVDCRSDALHLEDGTFWRAGLDLVLPLGKPTERYAFTAALQRYSPGAGMVQELHFGMTFWLL